APELRLIRPDAWRVLDLLIVQPGRAAEMRGRRLLGDADADRRMAVDVPDWGAGAISHQPIPPLPHDGLRRRSPRHWHRTIGAMPHRTAPGRWHPAAGRAPGLADAPGTRRYRRRGRARRWRH